MRTMERRNLELEQKFRKQFTRRCWFFLFVTILLYLILASRFAYLQIFQYDELVTKAEANRKTETAHPPRRGIIMDKNGEVLATNDPIYTLEITPAKTPNFNQTIKELQKVISISKGDIRRFNRLKDELPRLSPVPVKSGLTDEEVARFTAQSWRFPGVEVRSRMHRFYPAGKDAAHVVGYIGRISQRDQTRLEESGRGNDYTGTLNIGKTGIELSYEDVLHGKPGFEQIEVRASGRPIRSLSMTQPQSGNNLVLTLDMGLQREIMKELGDRRGTVIAIEPATGDVLAFVSNPSFDPNLFVDGIDQETWDNLNQDEDKPLMNRALRGTYPIGSTFKPFMALAALEMKVRDPKRVINDNGHFQLGNHVFRDSTRGRGYGPVDMHRSIVVSSDVYYYSLAQDMGIDRIHDFMKPFGFGQITGIDLVGEARGILPSREWKQRRFKQRWAQGDTISIGIGQGYNAFTILQLAHAVATLANDGIVMKPHLVKKIINSKTGEEEIVAKNPVDVIPLKKENVNFIKRAMQDVTQKGTGRAIFAGAPYTIGGKTGTAQVLGIKQGETYNKNKIKERHRDHSLFIAFAPVDKPKIALAIMVENGGFGAAAAAPLARKILDYYLIEQNKDKSSTEEAGKEKSQQTKPRNTAAEKKAVKPADKPQTTAAGTGKGKKE